MKLISILILTLFLSACSDRSAPPLEILGSVRGTLVDGSDGKKRNFIEAETININNNEGAVWYAYIRTNKQKIRYVEIIKMNGPTKWGVNGKEITEDDNNFIISDDKTTATVTREVENTNGFLYGAWKMDKNEPIGPMSVKVIVDGILVANYQWLIKND